jgi:hypothetical protein
MSFIALQDSAESIIPFLALKSRLESLPLRNLIEEFTHENIAEQSTVCGTGTTNGICLIQTGHQTRTYHHQELCWAVLERKIRSTFSTKGFGGNGEPTPRLDQILSLSFCTVGAGAGAGGFNHAENPPPTFFLRTMMQLCRTASDIKSLVERHPSVLFVEESEGNFLLHKVSMLGYNEAISVFEFVLFEGMKRNVHGKRGFGGLVTKNSLMRSPLVMMYGHTVRGLFYQHRWRWLATLIKEVVIRSIQDEDVLAYESNSSEQCINTDDILSANIPLLHAALEIGCPPGIINRIMKEERTSLFAIDMRGKTPLQIACSHRNGHATAVNITTLIRTDPKILLEKDSNGNWPIHLLLKSQIKSSNIYQDDITLIATFVHRAPQSLQIRDPQLNMHPFLLAAIADRWPIGVVYGLLRTAPHVLTELMK